MRCRVQIAAALVSVACTSRAASSDSSLSSRLDALEASNRALRAEVSSLRSQVTSAGAGSGPASGHSLGGLGPVRTFGTVVCNASEVVGGRETTVYEYTATGRAAVSAMTHWQFTANGTYEPWTIRIYVDGEREASVVISEWMGGGCESCGWGLLLPDDGPWGVRRIGKGSTWGGLYCNWRVPFAKTIRVTVQAQRFAVFFSILRGAEGVGASAGGLDLPPQARLRIQSLENATLPPLGLATVARSEGKAGVLAMWTLTVASRNPNFLEACTRVYSDGRPMYYVGDGEDFFDSAWYFNGGPYTFPQAGVSFMCGVGWPKPCPNIPRWPLGGCTNPKGCAGAQGAVIELDECNASDARQAWRWDPGSGAAAGASQRESLSAGGFVLPASANGDLSLGCVMDNVHRCGPGDALHLWEFDQTPNQLWNVSRAPKAGGRPGTLQAQLGGTCVTAVPAGGGSSAGLVMQACDDDGGNGPHSAAQQFELLPTGQLRSVKLPTMCVAGTGATVAGNTTTGTVVSAYRIFDDDPITWESRFTMKWRNGEVSPAGFPGMKCVEGDPGFPNGTVIGSPRSSLVNSYAWLYEW